MIDNFDFVTTLVFMGDMMKDMKPLATLLQRKGIDIHYALKKIEEFCEKMDQKLSSERALHEFKLLLDEAHSIFNSMKTSRDVFKNNRLSHETTKNYFDFYAKMYTELKKDLEARVGKREFLSSKICKLHPSMIHSVSDDDIDEIIDLFHSQINENGKEAAIRQIKKEIEHFRDFFNPDENSMSFISLWSKLDENRYKGLKVLFKIISTITITNSSAERAFSKLKLIKTQLRNRLDDENVKNEALLSINKRIIIDESTVLEHYCKEYSLRIAIE